MSVAWMLTSLTFLCVCFYVSPVKFGDWRVEWPVKSCRKDADRQKHRQTVYGLQRVEGKKYILLHF